MQSLPTVKPQERVNESTGRLAYPFRRLGRLIEIQLVVKKERVGWQRSNLTEPKFLNRVHFTNYVFLSFTEADWKRM